jgi:hypothetical protein
MISRWIWRSTNAATAPSSSASTSAVLPRSTSRPAGSPRGCAGGALQSRREVKPGPTRQSGDRHPGHDGRAWMYWRVSNCAEHRKLLSTSTKGPARPWRAGRVVVRHLLAWFCGPASSCWRPTAIGTRRSLSSSERPGKPLGSGAGGLWSGECRALRWALRAECAGLPGRHGWPATRQGDAPRYTGRPP